ncbi:SGNH/GDSL hydrolase family protein [Maribacter sp. 2304DJ31-5]|uniref:SGNH/GDSL hydrolase family protein n=1 Tax=Maribacter sp. 2304DJ31-5 TaxID=3386273 RepID=UPI0039BC363C
MGKSIKIWTQVISLITALVFSCSTFSQKDSLLFLALGDSYTIGTSESYPSCWPVQLQKILHKKGIHFKTPKIIAGAGWTSKKLLEELSLEAPTDSYHMISLLIGVNNQYRNQGISAFKKDFSTLLKKSIVLAKNNTSGVFVLSIPDWSVMPFARYKDKEKIVGELKEYNAIVKREAEKHNVLFIDITKLSRKALFDTSLIARDSLHPSRKMYKAWTRKISKELLKNFHF